MNVSRVERGPHDTLLARSTTTVTPCAATQAERDALAMLQNKLEAFDDILEERTFLVADRVTLADVAIACTMHPIFAQVRCGLHACAGMLACEQSAATHPRTPPLPSLQLLDQQVRDAAPHLTRWFLTCMHKVRWWHGWAGACTGPSRSRVPCRAALFAATAGVQGRAGPGPAA